VFASDIITLAPHVLAATTSQGWAIVLDERQKRCAVGGMQVSQHTGSSSRPPPITGTYPFIIVGTHGHLALYDMRKFPAVTYTNNCFFSSSPTTTRTFGGTTSRLSNAVSRKTPDFLRGAHTSVRVLDNGNGLRGGDFDTVHVAPGSRTTVAFQLSSGHVGISDLLRQGTNGVRVKVESAVAKRPAAVRTITYPSGATRAAYASVEGDLVEYGATMRTNSNNVADMWWVTRRRASLLSPDNYNGGTWRFYAPLVHRAGFRVLSLHPDLKTEVVGVKTGGKPVACVKALYAPGGTPAVAVGYTHLQAELYEARIR